MARRIHIREKRWKLPTYNFDRIQKEVSGVHLEEPSLPLSRSWNSEDDFVPKKTNQRKQRMSSDSPSESVSPISKSTYLSSGQANQGISKQFRDKCSIQKHHMSCSAHSSCEWESKSLLKPDINKNRSVTFSSDDSNDFQSPQNNQTGDGLGDVSETFTINMPSNEEFQVKFTCDSSQECSDEESKTSEETVTSTKKAKETKKRRFQKMIPRPLRRSHSAGCAKDVPNHALFLQYNDHNVESMENRKTKETDDEDPDILKSRPRIVHKTSSADAAMMATEEFGAIAALQTQKSRTRSIAKNMKRKFQMLKRRHTDSTLGTDGIKHIHRKNGSPSLKELSKWSESFDFLLSDKLGLDLFKDFLHSEFSEENLEFWLACEQYKSVKSSKLARTAQKIYTDFVAAQAPKEINLDSKTKGITLSNLSCPTRHCFQDAQGRVQALMEKDSYPRFLESDIYQRALLHAQNS